VFKNNESKNTVWDDDLENASQTVFLMNASIFFNPLNQGRPQIDDHDPSRFAVFSKDGVTHVRHATTPDPMRGLGSGHELHSIGTLRPEGLEDLLGHDDLR
jgi:hypothetical protein